MDTGLLDRYSRIGISPPRRVSGMRGLAAASCSSVRCAGTPRGTRGRGRRARHGSGGPAT